MSVPLDHKSVDDYFLVILFSGYIELGGVYSIKFAVFCPFSLLYGDEEYEDNLERVLYFMQYAKYIFLLFSD